MTNAIRQRLSAIRHLTLDMDGTIYTGSTLFECTRPFLNRMNKLGIGYTFLTNNSSKSARDYLEHLKKLDLGVTADQIFTSGLCTIEYLKTNHPGLKRVFILGTESLRREFEEAGFIITGESPEDEPAGVIVGFDTDLKYERLCMAAYWISQGKLFIATHPDLICPTDQKTMFVDCGAVCACLESATGCSPDIVLGKPHASMLEGILSRHGLKPEQLAMVGDLLYTDIAMAHVSGMTGVLVLSGESCQADVEECSTPPDLVVSDIGELGRLLQEHGK